MATKKTTTKKSTVTKAPAKKPAAAVKKAASKKTRAKKPDTVALYPKMLDVPGRNFKISCMPVPQAQWAAIMGKNPSKTQGADLPVSNVSWYECQEFIRRLNYHTELKFRLPTNEECCRVCMAKRSKSIEDFPVVCKEFGSWCLEAYDDNGWIGCGDVGRSPGDPDWGYAHTGNCCYDGRCAYGNDEEFSGATGNILHPTDREDDVGLVLVQDCE